MDTDDNIHTQIPLPTPPTSAQLTKARLQAAVELLEDVDTGQEVLTQDTHIHVTTALMALRKALDRYAWLPE